MRKFKVTVNGESFEVEVEEIGQSAPSRNVPQAASKKVQNTVPIAVPKKPAGSPQSGAVVAPMPGNINDIRVKAGERVEAGDILVVLEAMKMENEITADSSGTVQEVRVTKGQKVSGGDVLVIIKN